MMPELDGFGLLRALRADERTATIPVIMLSARAGEEARVEGLQAGADDYLVKPFSARELLARVETQLRRAPDARGRGDARAPPARASSSTRRSAIAILRGPEHVFEFANRSLPGAGRHRDVVGQADPRGASRSSAGRASYELLDSVFTSGEPYVGRSVRAAARSRQPGSPEESFFDFVYQPIATREARVDGIAVVVLRGDRAGQARGARPNRRTGRRTSSWRCSGTSCAIRWRRFSLRSS